MRVLVTGHRGYIGPHLVALLKQHGHHVTGCDLFLYPEAVWQPVPAPDRELAMDFRDLTGRELEGFDCVMHLAALSNDPLGEVDPAFTGAINAEGSIRLAERARRAGVARFLLASSCSMYGKGAELDLDETAPLNPVSAYARSKIAAEAGIARLADDSFCPAFLRNATAYGPSPVFRLDIVVNNLLGSALAYGQIRVMSDGTPWRPLISAYDIAAAFVAFLHAPRAVIFNQAVNIGADDQNYQVRDLAAIVRDLLPGTRIVYTGEIGADPRNYRVRFHRLNQLLPDFRLCYDVARGAAELLEQMRAIGFGQAEFEGDRFIRLRTLKKRLALLNRPAAAPAKAAE